MGRRTNPKIIGIFIVGALILAVLAVIVLGSGRIFTKTHSYVMFFKGNVNGLRVGAPVKFNGVEVGSVTKILLNLNLPENNIAFASPAQIRIPVVIELDQRKIFSRGGSNIELGNPKFLRTMIADGLRAQLEMQSLLTGLLYVDLSFYPGSPAHFMLPRNSPYQEIPTLPNTLEQVRTAATKLVTNLNKLDIQQLMASLTGTLNAIHEVVASPQLRVALNNLGDTAQSLNQTAHSIEKVAAKMNNEFAPLTRDLRNNSAQVTATLKKTQVTLASIQSVLSPTSPLVYQTSEALKNVSKAALAMQNLADYLQENPSAIVRGRYYGPDHRPRTGTPR
ncbi:MAG: MlaD family protein [Candidatus Binataceae bacterium]